MHTLKKCKHWPSYAHLSSAKITSAQYLLHHLPPIFFCTLSPILSSTYSLPPPYLSNSRGISPWVGDSPPRLWDLPGSPCIRVLPGAPRLSEEPHRSPHLGGRQHLRRGPACLWPPAGRRLANAALRWRAATAPGQSLTASPPTACQPHERSKTPPPDRAQGRAPVRWTPLSPLHAQEPGKKEARLTAQ